MLWRQPAHHEVGRRGCRSRTEPKGGVMGQALTPQIGARFAHIALGHVTREYPHKLDHVLAGAGDARTPSALHPIFHGSFDWHSWVHGYWLLARLLLRFPTVPFAAEIAGL